MANIRRILRSTFLLETVALQELWDERDGLLGRGEHALQREEEQHAGQDTRQEEGLGGAPTYPAPYTIIFLTEKKI